MKLAADDAVLRFIADRFVNNVRELEGALNCLQTLSSMTGKRISVTSARRVLSGLERDCLRIVRIADVEAAVCKLFRVSSDELKSACRTRSVTQPRMLAMYLARRLTQSAYSEIGEYFGGRNHATVMSAERKITRLIEEGECIRVASESWPMHDLVAPFSSRGSWRTRDDHGAGISGRWAVAVRKLGRGRGGRDRRNGGVRRCSVVTWRYDETAGRSLFVGRIRWGSSRVLLLGRDVDAGHFCRTGRPGCAGLVRNGRG